MIFRRIFRRSARDFHPRFSDFFERSLQLQGQIAARLQPRGRSVRDLTEVEFRVFSQWGEDGIIEWLVSHVPVPNNIFVEFGVSTFEEANCRFLTRHRNWRGLIMDGSDRNLDVVRKQNIFWMHDLTAVAHFIDAENINTLIAEAGFGGDIGILSIDIDGNDYWVWKAIDVVTPAIVICEVNPILGDTRAITVPYDPEFTRFDAHSSGLYFGASIQALIHCAGLKGYTFIGTNLNGINAFFVRNDLAPDVLSLIENVRAYPGRHRDSRGVDGKLTFQGGLKRLALIADLPVIDVVTGDTARLGDIADIYSDAWLAELK